MKTKVLILGAEPPFQGPWVPISDSEKWLGYMETIPATGIDVDCRLEVADENDSITSPALGEVFSGVKVRTSVKKAKGIDNVSISIKEVEE